jgi:hypothetical protein
MCTFAVIKIDNFSNLIVGLKNCLVINEVELANYTGLQLRKLCLLCTQYCFLVHTSNKPFADSGVPRNFVRGGSTNSVEGRGQRGWGSGGGRPLVGGSGAAVI